MQFLLASDKSLGEALKEVVLPNDVNFFGLGVHPSFYSGLIVTAFLLFVALIIRIFVIPRFKMVPGKFQVLLELAVGFFSKMSKDNSPHSNGYLGAFIFSAAFYIFFGTLIELIGFPAVLVDINGALAMALLSYMSILIAGFIKRGFKGGLSTLKDFSLPFSMTFRLFGNMLSGVLVTALVYEVIYLSFVVPIIVAILFTLLHAIVQTYIYTLLTSMFFGEATEHHDKKVKHKKLKKQATTS